MKPKPSKFSKVFSTFLTFFLFIPLLAGIFLFIPQQVRATSLDNDIVGFWKLEEASGAREDTVGTGCGGSGCDLTDNNTVTQAVGKIGNAAQFTVANSEYLSYADHADLSTGDIDFTIAAWVYLDSKTAIRGIAEKGNNTSGYGKYEWNLRYNNTLDRFRFTVQNGVNSSADATANNLGSPSLSTWYFVVAWHDAGNNTVNIQVNNGIVDSTSYTSGSYDSSHPFTVGRGTSSYFGGRIDSVGFWKRTLTSGERTALYNSGNGDEYPFTVGIPAGITATPTSGLTTTEAGGTDTFTVVLDSQPTYDVVIDLSSSDTSEGTVSPSSLTFTDANWDTPQTVTVTGVNDDEVDGDVVYTILTAAASSSDPDYNTLDADDVSLTNTDNDTPPVIKNRMIAKPTSDSVTVLVKTDISTDVTIDYGSTDSYGNTVTSTNQTHHEIAISSLSPSTTYHYRVTAAENGNASNTTSTSDSTFKTQLDAGSDFSFVVISDNQGHDYSESVTQIQALNPDLIISAGDNIKGTNFTPGSFANYVNAWQTEVFDYIQNLSDHIPFFYALGNHDDALNGLYSDGIAAFEQEVSNPTSASGGEEYYSFDWGDAHFAVLNGTYNGGGSNGTIDSTQLTWLQNDLSSTSKKWKFVICHYLIYGEDTASPWRLSNYSNVATVLQNNGAIAWINGHRHMYNRYVKNGIFYIANPNTSDTLIGNADYDNSGGDSGTIANASQYLGFTKVSVTSSRVSMIVYQKDGTVIDSFDLTPTNFELSIPSNNGYTNDSTPTFAWNASSDNASGLAKYQLYVGGSLAQDSISSGATSIDAPSTLTDGAHTWYLKAVNNAGWSTQSTSTYTINIDTAAPSSVGAPTFGTITASSIEINKPSSATENGSGLYQWQAKRNSATELGLNATTTSFVTDSSLSENTQYTYDVQFKDNVNNLGDYGTAASKYTLADTPTNLDNSATRDSINLTVDSFPNASSGSSGYYFYRTDDSSHNSGWISKNSWADTGLTCGSKYTYGVKYRNGDSVETSAVTLSQNTEPCVSEGGASEDDNIDKEATPTVPNQTALNPQGDFSIVVNGDAKYTNTRTVKLKLLAGSDTKYMLVSENPNFTGAVQEKYVPDKSWTLSRSDGKKTIYAKFLTLYDVASEVVSDSIILDTTAPPLSITDPKNYSSLTDSTPTIQGTSEPDASIVLELQTQDGAKSYYSTETDQEGTFEYTFLTPLKNQDYTLNITSQDQAENLSKAQTIHFKIQTQKVSLVPELPALTPLISPPAEEEQEITPPSIPEEQPSPEQEEAVPSLPEKEVSLPPLNLQSNLLLFKSLYGNISLKTPLTLISGQKLKAFLKPVKPVKAVKVTIIFQKPAEKDTSYETAPTPSISPSGRGSSLLSAMLGIPNAQAQTWRIAEYTLTDENKDGIYEGEITLPETTGTYLIRTTLFYADGTLENLDTETLIDPKGYIYTPASNNQQTRINKAAISLYVFNSETSEFELWQSTPYGQENPQTTDKTGEYEFLVPEGRYYLQITTKGYQTYKGEEFQAQEGDVIHQNIELKPEKRINNRFLIMGSVVLILVIGAGIGFWKKRRG